MSELSEKFMSEVMCKIRSGRNRLPKDELYFNRIEKGVNGNVANIWFMTRGCSWDQSGGCTMCNYGKGYEIASDKMLEVVETAFSDIHIPLEEVFVSPSGSMFDNSEVPPEVRKNIFLKLDKISFNYFACETRVETINEIAICEMRECLPSKRLGIEVGWESANNWIRHYCINKGTNRSQFYNAIKILKKYDIEILANISIGNSFLSMEEAIADSANSVKWVLDNGVDTAVLFPIHIKPHTLLDFLNQKDMYQQISLWALVEVLDRIGPEARLKTDISWYRNGYGNEKKVISSPTTCCKCYEKVLSLLDDYRETRSEEIFEKLKNFNCDCRIEFEEELDNKPDSTLAERVFIGYEVLAKSFMTNEWWEKHRLDLKEEIVETYLNRKEYFRNEY